MIRAALPGFLWAGAAFALLPLALHFLTRRPPERQALPTARFLREDARTFVRLRRTPSDVLLLLLRVAFALLLGAAFAELSWLPGRSGEGSVVLLDAGSAWTEAGDAEWSTALTRARETAARMAETNAEVVVVVYGVPGAPRVLEPAQLDEAIQPGATPATFADGLRALRGTALARRWSTARATWITPGTWAQWTPGLALLRPALWPGSIVWEELAEHDGGAPEPAPSGAEPRRVRIPDVPERPTLARALEAAGLVLADGSAGTDPDVVELVSLGRAEVPTGDGFRLIAVHGDATPRATAEDLDEGCRIHLADRWGALVESEGPALPDFLTTLVEGCGRPAAGVRIDTAARSILTGADLPRNADLRTLEAAGVRLTRPILAVLCLLVLAELARTARRGASVPASESRG